MPATNLHVAVARYGQGADHIEGEWVVAFRDTCSDHADTSLDERAPKHDCQWIHGYEILTDRRPIGMADSRPYQIDYRAVTGLRIDSGLLSDTLVITSQSGALRIESAPHALHRFLSTLLHPPRERLAIGQPPAIAATEQDGTGAAGAAAHLVSADPRPRSRLAVIPGLHAREALGRHTCPPRARVPLDRVWRVRRAHESLRGRLRRRVSPTPSGRVPRA